MTAAMYVGLVGTHAASDLWVGAAVHFEAAFADGVGVGETSHFPGLTFLALALASPWSLGKAALLCTFYTTMMKWWMMSFVANKSTYQLCDGIDSVFTEFEKLRYYLLGIHTCLSRGSFVLSDFSALQQTAKPR